MSLTTESLSIFLTALKLIIPLYGGRRKEGGMEKGVDGAGLEGKGLSYAKCSTSMSSYSRYRNSSRGEFPRERRGQVSAASQNFFSFSLLFLRLSLSLSFLLF